MIHSRKAAYLGASLLCLLFVVLSFAKIRHGGTDFKAFHLVGERILSGVSPYVATDPSPFKYAPIIGLLLAPFSFIDFDFSKQLFALLNALVVFSLPFVVFRIAGLRLDTELRPSAFVKAISLGLLASLRFVDNEFHSAQVNGLSLLLILSAAMVWTQSKTSNQNRRTAAGASLYGLGALFKFHPFFGCGLFLSPRSIKTVTLLSILFLAMMFLPFPQWTLELPQHFAQTNKEFIMKDSPLFQGFFPFAVEYFGWPEQSMRPFLLFVITALPLLYFIPKFSLVESNALPLPSERPRAFLFSLASLLLLALMSSPLPWHHTYLPLWAFVPASFLLATAREKFALVIAAVLIGLSARGILGKELADRLEISQLIFISSLLVLAVFAHQAKRFYRTELS